MSNVTKFAMLMVCIDGSLQQHEQGCSVSTLIEDGDVINRVECTWAVPSEGLEFDGRLLVGTDHEFRIDVASAPWGSFPRTEIETPGDWLSRHPAVVSAPMRLAAFEMRQKNGSHAAQARGVFENRMPRVRQLKVASAEPGPGGATVHLVDPRNGDRYRVSSKDLAATPEP